MSNYSNITLGRQGEKLALKFLEKKGYILRHKNWRYKKLELDIVVEKENLIVFVEVKTRSNMNNNSLDEIVSISQQKRIIHAAHNYIQEYNLDEEIRFDLVGVYLDNNSFNFKHYKEFIYPIND